MNSSPEYLTKRHASIIYDLSNRSLTAAVRRGDIRASRIGRKTLIEKASIDSWIQGHEITPMERRAQRSELAELMDRAIALARKART